jgi:hypothetical protein
LLIIVTSMSTALRALLGAAMGRQDLEAGITTVALDVGNSGLNGDVALRDAIESDWVAARAWWLPREHSRRRTVDQVYRGSERAVSAQIVTWVNARHACLQLEKFFPPIAKRETFLPVAT